MEPCSNCQRSPNACRVCEKPTCPSHATGPAGTPLPFHCDGCMTALWRTLPDGPAKDATMMAVFAICTKYSGESPVHPVPAGVIALVNMMAHKFPVMRDRDTMRALTTATKLHASMFASPSASMHASPSASMPASVPASSSASAPVKPPIGTCQRYTVPATSIKRNAADFSVPPKKRTG